jgi:hypothetical protein|tara:strand:+ start:8905 stop:9348 length:444 start_codon:yes stop_codon:yes gene_type:complete
MRLQTGILIGILVSYSISVNSEDNDFVDNTLRDKEWSMKTIQGDNNFGKGQDFFKNNVLPKLAENGCLKCHARGYLRPNITVYEELLRRLAIGDSSENNAVIYKIANIRSFSPEIPNHPGGQRCASINVEPCSSIRQWWEIEFGDGN